MDKTKEVFDYLKEHSDNEYLAINDIYNRYRIGISDSKDYNLSIVQKMMNKVKEVAAYWSVYIIVFANLSKRKEIDPDMVLAFARVQRVKDKLSKIDSELQYITDDIKHGDFTIYKIGNKNNRLSFLFRRYRSIYKSTINSASKMVDENAELRRLKNYYLHYLKMRAPHHIWFGFACEEIFKATARSYAYTGDIVNLANVIERRTAQKHDISLVCIPHGREYIIPMPAGIMGNKNYCTTKSVANKLQELYPDQEFFIDYDINRRIYSYSRKERKDKNPTRVVYFTESLDLGVAFVKEISPKLEEIGLRLYVKLHPEDLNQKELYNGNNVSFIDNYSEAITDCLALAFRSTVLIEAIYNGSIPICLERMYEINYTETSNEYLETEQTLLPASIDDLMQIVKQIMHK